MTVRERFHRALCSTHAPAYAAALAFVLALPSLGVGFVLDDHLMPAHARAGAPAWERFIFSGEVTELREQGSLGWWAGDDFAVHFMRPLSSLTHSLDFTLWPEAAWLMHLENAAIYALLTWAVARLFQRVHGPGLLAGSAGLCFAVDEAHAAAFSWICARNTILAALFGVLALLAHLRWRSPEPTTATRGAAGYAVLATSCFALALASAEAGLCALGYLAAWSLLSESGPWWRRALPLAPYLLVVIAWRVAYVSLGYGATDSLIYLDFSAHPLRTAVNILTYPPSLGLSQLTLPLTDLLLVAPWSCSILIPCFAGLLWVLAPALRGTDSNVWLLGMLLAAIPFAATTPSTRLMLILGIGGAGVVGRVVEARERLGQDLSRGRRAVFVGVIVVNLWLAPLLSLAVTATGNVLEAPHRALAEGIPEDTEDCVIINVATEISALYPKAIRETRGGTWPDHTYLLFAGRVPVEVERVGPRELVLHSPEGWAATPIDRFSRDWTRGFSAGDVVELERATVLVETVNDEARPTQIRVHFLRDLDEIPLLGFGREGGAGLARWRPQLGERARFRATAL